MALTSTSKAARIGRVGSITHMVMEMVEMDNVVRCYRGIDPLDGSDMLYAVKNGRVAPSNYRGERDSWLTYKGFRKFDEWYSDPDERDGVRLAALDTFELLWEKHE